MSPLLWSFFEPVLVYLIYKKHNFRNATFLHYLAK